MNGRKIVVVTVTEPDKVSVREANEIFDDLVEQIDRIRFDHPAAAFVDVNCFRDNIS